MTERVRTRKKDKQASEGNGLDLAPLLEALGRIEAAISKTTLPLALRLDEVAAMTGQSKGKLYSDCREGRLKLRKNGKTTLCLTEEVIDYLRALPFADLTQGDREDDTERLRDLSLADREMSEVERQKEA